jgi:hypothetical protein
MCGNHSLLIAVSFDVLVVVRSEPLYAPEWHIESDSGAMTRIHFHVAYFNTTPDDTIYLNADTFNAFQHNFPSSLVV